MVTEVWLAVELHTPHESQTNPYAVNVPMSAGTVVFVQDAWLPLLVEPLVQSVWLAAQVPGNPGVIAFVLHTVSRYATVVGSVPVAVNCKPWSTYTGSGVSASATEKYGGLLVTLYVVELEALHSP